MRVSVLGAGAWGTALAILVARAGHSTILWARRPEHAAAIRRADENCDYLPGIPFAGALTITDLLAEAVATDMVLLAVPAQHLRTICAAAAPYWQAATPAVICAKGIEIGSDALPADVVAATLPGRPVLVLSGPTFAGEAASGAPTAAVVAGDDAGLAARTADALGSGRFRLYHSTDPVGVQVGGALKNVIAIAAGIVVGRGLGDNARAALVTRGLAEIARVGTALGGEARTFMGLSGLGDLILTCGAMQSRNHALGIAIGQGRSAAEVLASRRTVSEGFHTARAAAHLGRRLGLDLPLTEAVAAILHEGASLDETIAGLMARPQKAEG